MIMKSTGQTKVHSIKYEISALFIGIMVATFALIMLANLFFMEKFYIRNKREAIVSAYRSISEALGTGDITSDEFDEELRHICERYNIEMIVLDEDSQTVKSSSNNSDFLVRVLWGNIIGSTDENKTILDSGKGYTIQIDEDRITGRKYLEMWGIVETGHLLLIRTTMESIRDSVIVSNTFMAYVALIAIVIGSVMILFISKRVSGPIEKVYRISDEMKKLNFEAKYYPEGKYRNEIDVLGQNMNEVSETLESNLKQLKNANIQLQQDIAKKEEIDEMRKEFLSNVSHELKTPIALIQGYAEGLKEGVNDDEESRNFYCEVIMDEASKMNIMVKKLLTLNQLEFGNDNLNMERFDIVDMISNYLKSALVLAEKKGAEVRFSDYQPIFVWGDEFKVEEVLQNYFSNAVNHVEGDNIIEVKLMQSAAHVRISVFNTGRPIPEESISQIWDKFYKVDKARTREYGGSGVGLSIVKAIMEAMKQDYGVINYDNGVEFYFELETK